MGEVELTKDGDLVPKTSSATPDPSAVVAKKKEFAQARATVLTLMDPAVDIASSPFVGGFRETLDAHFPYADVIRLTPGTSVAYYLFRATDMYDPDYTGTGHQPLGFDQYMLFYNHFVVAGSEIEISVHSESTEPAAGSYYVGLRLGASTTTYTTITEFMEDPWSVWGYCKSSPYGSCELKMRYDAKKYYGLNRQLLLSNPAMWGSASASPSEDAYFQVALFSIQPGTTSAVAANVAVNIKYHAVLSEPKLLAQS
jgi:hypothetical protein